MPVDGPEELVVARLGLVPWRGSKRKLFCQPTGNHAIRSPALRE